jgi:selenocysteine lyase/cysteine desulfurase
MMGPYSFGFLYVSPKYQTGTPLEENWVSRLGAENFSSLGKYESHYQAGARRFDMGERSNPVLLPMAIRAIDQILEWAPEKISSRLRELTGEIASHATKRGYSVYDEAFRSPHFLGLRFPGKITPEVADRFSSKKIYLSVRGDCLRIAPHLHVTRADMDRLLESL